MVLATETGAGKLSAAISLGLSHAVGIYLLVAWEIGCIVPLAPALNISLPS